MGEQDSRGAAVAAADKDSLASKADGGARSTPDTEPTPNQELRRRLYELLSTVGPPRRELDTAKAGGKNRVHLFGESSRSHRKRDLTLAGKFRVLSQECHDLTAVKISSGGMLLEADRELPIGALVEIHLVLPESDREVRIPGRVICVNEKETGTYEAAICVFRPIVISDSGRT